MVLKLSAKDRHAAATSLPVLRSPCWWTVASQHYYLDLAFSKPNLDTRRRSRTRIKRRRDSPTPTPASHEPGIVFFESSPPPDPGKHQRKRATQWQRWQHEVLPKLLPELAQLLEETKSLRELEGRCSEIPSCACHKKRHRVAVVYFSNIKDVDLTICECTPAAVQLMRLAHLAALPSSLRWPWIYGMTLERVLANMGFQLDHQNSFAASLGNCLMWYTHLRNLLKKKYTVMLEAIRTELVGPEVLVSPSPPPRSPSPPRGRPRQRAEGGGSRSSSSSGTPTPTTPTPVGQGGRPHSASTAHGHTGGREPTPAAPRRDRDEDSTPHRFSRTHRRSRTDSPPLQDVEEMETRPPPLLADAQAVENRLPPLQDMEEMETRPPPLADGQTVENRLPLVEDVEEMATRPPPLADGQAVESRLPPLADANVVESRHLSHRKYHFLNRLLDCDPANTSARRCPACFGNLKHDPSEIADVIVCIDACFTQKKRKSPRDPPRTHPDTHFVPEEQCAQTEEYVDGVRGTSGEQTERERKRPAVQEVDEEDGYEYARLPLPHSVLDACEASFKAADEKRQKTSTDFFDDTALMALLCRHDRVLFVANMHSAGEKQFYVIALVETFFQHLPLEIRVGLMYDVACSAERSCLKWGFLARYMDRIAFAVSVFHAFGHEWACQLLYHPRKQSGFGLSNGEGAERFWKSISHLIAHLHICGYHNRLYTLDAQIEHADQQSLLRLGEWINRRYRHSLLKRAEAEEELRKCGKPTELLRRAKNRGEKAVNAVMLLRSAIKTREAQVEECRKKFLDAVVEEDEDAGLYEAEYDASKEALVKAQSSLRRKEQALGVDEQAELKSLAKSEYMRLRMNARALKLRLRERLRARKFELDVVERSYPTIDAKLHAHTESAVKRREPTISKLATEYNKLCKQIDTLIRAKKAPRKAIAPLPIPREGLWQLNVDNAIFQDVGLDDHDDDYHDHPPLWLCDEKVRTGIKAMLDLDCCDEEDARLRGKPLALQAWFAEEWQISTVAIEVAASGVDEYHLQLHQDKLVQLCATDGFIAGMGSLAGAAVEVSCRRACAGEGEDRHYGKKKRSAKNEEEEEEEEAESGDEEGGFWDFGGCRKGGYLPYL
ncbi:hypothetical protein MSAN_02210100 [Mycena sanguinolenta]|uniref:CxC1-like cysteine cluster associated with KDZ transposases domain-containing protein n=1 Tax=Mycena sanguinolenta TaxID=230812 RepID=A0A8H6XEB0_9AGAR|nr:hypothetical protein MSAN_02210100 [Mycena sanguinolenta]